MSSRLSFPKRLFALLFILLAAAAPASISTSWLAILCEYPDINDPLPSTAHFQTLLLGSGFPSVDHWLNEVSYGRANFQGSRIVGPYQLPKPYAGYNFDYDPYDPDPANAFPSFVMDVFIPDIMSQVREDVDIRDFFGFFFIMNEDPTNNLSYGPALTSFATGGVIDGQSYSYIVMGPGFGWRHQRIFAHETLHAFGISHSSRPDFFLRTPHWDNMGGDGTCDGGNPSDPLFHPLFGCPGIHTIAWHKVLAGCIDPERVFETGTNGVGIVSIERLEFPPLSTGSYLMAQLSVPWSSVFYTVEYRRRLGYDGLGAIPGDGIVVHSVDPDRTDIFGGSDFFAQVWDADANGDPNDQGAIWLPGETLQLQGGMVLHVEEMDPDRAIVSISNRARSVVYSDGSYDGFEDGSAANPWDTVEEAYASVNPGGTVYITPGTYSETIVLTKRCRLERQGAGGEVVIGR